jgi:hypothetical protein
MTVPVTAHDGRTLALVPDDADLRPAVVRAPRPRGDLGELAALVELLVATVEARIRRLEQQVEAERGRGAAMIARLQAELAEQTAQSDLLLVELEQARTAHQEALEAAEALRQTDNARRAKGRLRRVLAAWHGQ